MKVLNASKVEFLNELKGILFQKNQNKQVEETVRSVLNDISSDGDSAVLRYTKQFDQANLTQGDLRVHESEIAEAEKVLNESESSALDEAIRSVEFFHKKCLPEDWLSENQHGAVVGEKYDPIQRVGIYIPGGQVPLVSTVIMTVTLAKIAGVPEIVVVTPPRKDGSIHPYLLAAMSRIGVKEIYRMGGIQAVGALAFGTETVPSVDKIFGPGNAYVMEAKRQVLGVCGMDLLPGPSEIMVIGDETANPAYIAADLLAQAEHGSGKEKVFWASVGNHSLKDQVILEINKQIQTLSHKEKIRYIIEEACILIQCENIDQAISAANKIAPEHLELHLSKLNEDHCIEKILTAGCMLLGEMSPTVLGDFVAGPSHTLPTGTSGRFFSGLRLEDFMRRTSLIRYSRESANLARGAVKAFSEMEQLDAHGNSLEIRFHRS